MTAAVTQLVKNSPRMRKVGCSNPSRDRPKSLKQSMTAPMLNARQQMLVLRVLGVDHYKPVFRVTIGVTRSRTLTAHWP